jgi:signal transduction histidine kinase
MKLRNYKYILALITITILATISLQIYWNIKNYHENKRTLLNEVQIAFDNSIEYYYAEDVKNDFLAFVDQDTTKNPGFIDFVINDTIFKNNLPKRRNSVPKKKNDVFVRASKKLDTFNLKTTIKISNINGGINKDNLMSDLKDSLALEDVVFEDNVNLDKPETKLNILKTEPSKISSIQVFKGKKSVDSISKLAHLANKIVISMFRDSIEFKKVSKALNRELARKDIQIQYQIKHFKADTLFESFGNKSKIILPLNAYSKSTFLPQDQKLELLFSNPTVLLLKRSMMEIILSLLLSLSIIGCLLYLLRTINRQKKVDEIKNDLISNITHEFKTPITTVSTAIEGIRNFNDRNDLEKTNRYLDISNQQLKKLEIMVEKLLETASLDTDKLLLQKEPTNLIYLLKNLIDKHKMICPSKEISLHSNMEQLIVNVDLFHFENALSNLIDNAIKYGGETINVNLNYTENTIEITVEDDGNGIEKSQREKIFDKFYRIPKGNQHDVKGFGIGLYYSKKIIEKHGGKLELLPNPSLTIFKIKLTDV